MFWEYGCKNPQHNTSKVNLTNIQKKIILPNQVRFAQELQSWFNMCKSSNKIHHINRIQDKHHMITSADGEKALRKI